MPRYSTVLFDLDGTLLDSTRLILDSFHHTFAAHGLPAQSDEAFLAGVGTPLRVEFAKYCNRAEDIEAMIATYREYNFQHHDRMVSAFPGALACVRALAHAKVRLGIVTSKGRHGAKIGLDALMLRDVFEVLVCAEDVTKHKPDPEPVLHALEKLGVRPSETIFIGDSVHDMRSGRGAQVATGAALWGPFARQSLVQTEPTFFLESFADVEKLILD
ncbi:MAG TPA: HAD-IA family hydrolase [Polyangium sp.]|nr:HAD-IA family hydrolase [Polyangium sp.]